MVIYVQRSRANAANRKKQQKKKQKKTNTLLTSFIKPFNNIKTFPLSFGSHCFPSSKS